MEKYNLTYPQKNIWLVEKYNGATPINSIVGTIEIKDEFDEKLCIEAINYVIKINDAMRFCISENSGNVEQYVKEYEKVDIKTYDLTGYTLDQINNYKEKFAMLPLDILKNELFEFCLLRYSQNSGAILMKIHHIISDAWSCSKIGTDIVEYMRAKTSNEEVVEENRPSYTEYILSEREYEISEKYQKDKEFWEEYLKDVKEPIGLKDTFENISKEARRYSVVLSDEENKKINEYCKANKISVYALFLATLSTYIYRIKENNDFIIGTPVLNRSNFKEKNMVGMFVSTIPLRIKIEENEKFIELAKSISTNNLSLFRHQKYPYSKTLEFVRQNTDVKSNLYNIVLSYQNARADMGQDSIYSTTWVFNKTLNDQLQIHIMDMDNTGKLNINYDYLSDIFDEIEIKYLHTRLMATIFDAIDNINIDVENIRIMSQEEENKILYEFNDTKADYPKDKTVIQLFEEQVEKTPDNIALVFEDKTMTYKELNEKANQLAHYLRDEKNIKPNDVVGIILERGFDIIISILSILKAGGTYLPIDKDFPKDRINYILNNSNAKLLLTNTKFDYANCIKVEVGKFEYDKYSNCNLNKVNSINDLIYIIYTSGTTGNPKGVMVRHFNVTNLCFAANEFQNLEECNIWGNFSSYSFDISVLEIFVPLVFGKVIIIASEEQQKMPEKMFELINSNNIEVVYMTPTRIQLLINFDKNGFAISKLKRILLGGEVFPINYYEMLRNFTDAIIYDGYGPTEITVWSSAKEIKSKYDINIGKPLSNMKAYILDEQNRILPIGCKGELCVGGDGVALGYYNNEEITNKKFIKLDDNNRIYKTGDISKFNFEGELEYIGRKDNQVKLHGLRIETGEIESAIKSFQNIKQSAVIVKDGKLYAYFSSDKKISNQHLKKYLKRKLPNYMVPIFYLQVEKFDFTILGKIDKSKLPEIEKELVDYIPPRNNIESKLVYVLSNLLKIEKIGIDDNLFELGLDSLNAIIFITELNKENIRLTYGNIFDYPTVRELYKCITNIDNNEGHDDIKYYDYSDINKLLNNNKISNINDDIKSIELGNVLLFGATGFLGVHILSEFIENEKGNIYCIIRSKDDQSSLYRLIDKLKFYYGGKYIDRINKRIFVLDGDMEKEKFGLNDDELNKIIEKVDTVINSASKVSHFGDECTFKSINLYASNNIGNFCLSNNKKLIHISTLSVSGNSLEGGYIEQDSIKEKLIYDETKLFVNQNLNNVYVYTKFLAERYLLELKQKGLNLKIMRLGNLTSRLSDNKFQINKEENAFRNRIKTLLKIKILPENLENFYLEFTPIDIVAHIILNLSKVNDKFFMFHLYNHNHIPLKKFVNILRKIDVNIKFVSKERFSKKMSEYMSDDRKVKEISGIIIDLNSNNELNYQTNIAINSNYTTTLLNKLNINWPEINNEYILKYVSEIMGEEDDVCGNK